MENKPITIYSLANPFNNEVFYIGRTTMDLPKRLGCHVSPSAQGTPEYLIYMKMLRDKGVRPIIDYIDDCSFDNRKPVEEFWIQTFSSWGFPLVNKKHLKNKNWEGYKEKQRKRNRSFILKTIDPDTLVLIRMLYDSSDCQEISKRLGCTKERMRGMLDKFIRLELKKLMEWVKQDVENYYIEKGKLISDTYLKTIKQ